MTEAAEKRKETEAAKKEIEEIKNRLAKRQRKIIRDLKKITSYRVRGQIRLRLAEAIGTTLFIALLTIIVNTPISIVLAIIIWLSGATYAMDGPIVHCAKKPDRDITVTPDGPCEKNCGRDGILRDNGHTFCSDCLAEYNARLRPSQYTKIYRG